MIHSGTGQSLSLAPPPWRGRNKVGGENPTPILTFPPQGGRDSAGFSALELLVVMVIVSMVFTTAIVFFNPFTKTARTRTASSDMADLLRLARNSAIIQRTDCTLQIITNPEGTSYLGVSPQSMWVSFGETFEDVKPPSYCVVIYFSNPAILGQPLDTSQLPQGIASPFVKWFTPLPTGVSWMNAKDPPSDEEINGIRFVFDKRGALRCIMAPTEMPFDSSGQKDRLPDMAIKIVEQSTAQDDKDAQLLKYLVLIPATGSVRILDALE